MPSNEAYNDVVEARARLAVLMLDPKNSLLEKYVALGGAASDLEEIRDQGLKAQALNVMQTVAIGAGVGSTEELGKKFLAVQVEYSNVMAAVQAARLDLKRKGASDILLATIDKILVNEAQHVIAAIRGEKGLKREAKRSMSMEAIRAEIEKDAVALGLLKEAHAVLGDRKVTTDRLKKLADGARSLSGKLGERIAKKGAAKDSTTAEHDAVGKQAERWVASRRLLGKVGRQDQTVADALQGAAK